MLVSPANGSVVPRYGPSPLFRWRITEAGAAPASGSGRLEVSTAPSFAQSVIYSFDCGAAAGACPEKHRWPASQPYWYDLANSCSDVPPVGSCGGLSRTLYWRVRYEPAGAASSTSPVGVLERAVSADRTRPLVTTVPGSSRFGGTAAVTFFVSDGSGSVRDIVELEAGARVVFGVRTAWTAVARVRRSFRSIVLPLPPTIGAGRYRVCVTAQDQADNRATSCAAYTITAPPP